MKVKWAIFISGFGSNLQAILDLHEAVDVALVVSSNPQAYGLERAQIAGRPVLVLSNPVSWPELDQKLREYGIDRIFLAGFMKIIPPEFIESWQGKILNLHPSLLPNFKGLKAIEKSYESGQAMGVTIHVVTSELDAGPIVIQREVIPQASTGKHSLSLAEAQSKIHEVEHQVVREAILKWNHK